MRELKLPRSQVLPGVVSAAMLAALGVALLPGIGAALPVALAALGALGMLAYCAPSAARTLLRRRSMLLVLVVAALIVAWIAAGIIEASNTRWWWYGPHLHSGQVLPAWFDNAFFYRPWSSWPWRVDRVPLLPLVLAMLCAGGGFVLIADAVRVQIGLARPPRSVWRSLTSTPTRGGRVAARAIPGVTLIAVATFLGISLVSSYSEYHPIKGMLELIALAGCAALLIVSPIAIGMSMRLDLDKEGRAREEERRRFAAHLHDSVLQTLALIQRQASDSDAVTKLARRQEHALRAWMAGEADLSSATVAIAVREMIGEVEDEHGLKVELTAIGDARLDSRSEEMIAAAREALRNVARHAPGAPVNVFLDIGPTGTEMFIRDSGPGFEFASVPSERRGLRDAVIGRMSFAGGGATVESTPGEGTEVALKLPPRHNGRGR